MGVFVLLEHPCPVPHAMSLLFLYGMTNMLQVKYSGHKKQLIVNDYDE